MPTALAIARPVQWVAAGGFSVVVFVTTCWITAADSLLRPGGRVLSRSKPSTPEAANRACHRHTVGFDWPVRRAISIVPTPSVLNSTIQARQTCFWGVLRSATSLSSRARSSGERWTSTPVLIGTKSYIPRL
jgi:hypothetical protein